MRAWFSETLKDGPNLISVIRITGQLSFSNLIIPQSNFCEDLDIGQCPGTNKLCYKPTFSQYIVDCHLIGYPFSVCARVF